MNKKIRQLRLSPKISSNVYSGTQELLDTEAGLKRYSTGIVQNLFTKMGLKQRNLRGELRVLEFGAGVGYLAEIFRNQFQLEIDCVEIDPQLASLIREKNFKCFQFLGDCSHKYGAIYTSNVLEHIEKDVDTLVELYDTLKPGGVIGIYVPAHPFLYSSMDLEVGHVRRYKRKELKRKVQEAGFKIESLTYDEFLGFFASAIVKGIGYKNKANLGSQKSLIFYDKVVYPVSSVLDLLGCRYIVGKNLILIATKPDN
jgi:SAM-dependent methyltransferase